MENMTFLLRFLIYGIIGHYITRLASKKENLLYGPFSLTYGIFGLLAFSVIESILGLFFVGIIWGVTLDLFANSLNRKLSLEFWPPLYGLLNIINVIVFEPMIDKIIFSSSNLSIGIATIFILIFTLMDMSISLRNNI